MEEYEKICDGCGKKMIWASNIRGLVCINCDTSIEIRREDEY